MTKTELIKKVLQRLRVLETGETPDADQTTTVGDAYDSVYQELRDDEIVTWTASGEIPDKESQQMISIMAGRLVDEFSIPEGRAQRLILQGESARDRLFELNTVPYDSTTEPEYY